MSQDRRLEEMIAKICITSKGHTPSGCGTGCDLDSREVIKQAILEVMRGCVPEEYDGVDWKDTEVPFVWNAFRTEMLRRIEEVGK